MWSCSKCNYIMKDSDMFCNNCGSSKSEGNDYISLVNFKKSNPKKKSILFSVFSYFWLFILLLYILYPIGGGVSCGIVSFFIMKHWFYDKGIDRGV